MSPFLNRSISYANKSRFKMHKMRRNKGLRDMEASLERLKAEMEEIGKEQRGIREGQRQVGEKFQAIESECEHLRRETRVVLQQSARNKIRLVLMFKILKAREDGDYVKTTQLTQWLREMISRENAA